MISSPLVLAAVVGALGSPSLVRAHWDESGPYSTISDGLNCTSFNAPITASAMNFDLSFLGGKPVNQQVSPLAHSRSGTQHDPLPGPVNG